MRRIFIAAIAAFILSTGVSAQTRVGVKGAFNYATAAAKFNNVKQSTAYRTGWGIGMTAKVDFDEILHFSPSVMVNQRGYIINNTNCNGIRKFDNSIYYLDLYPALSLDFGKNGRPGFCVDFGPQFSVALAGTEKTTDASGAVTSKKMKFSTTGQYGFFDIGLSGGLSYHFEKFFIDTKYYHGMASINNEEEFDARNIKNRVFSLGIGFYIR